jgi:hypoxanthine phosphoribosyltransferase
MEYLLLNVKYLYLQIILKIRKMIHLHDKTFEPFISSEEIDFAIKNLAKQMDDDFFNEVPVFVGVLNGAFMVMADLMKYYRGMCEVSFVKMASYEGTANNQ